MLNLTNTSNFIFPFLAKGNGGGWLPWWAWLIIIILVILLLWYLWKWFTRPKRTGSLPTPAAPAVKSAEPVVKAVQPVVKSAEPVVKSAEPVVKAVQPVVKAVQPVVKAVQPVVKAAEPVVKAAQPVVKAAEVVIPAAPSPIKPDDLTIIEGIGPKIASLLQAAGIKTFNQLVEADLNRVVQILQDAGLQHLADPATWPEQAKLAAEGKWEEFKTLTDSLKGGRRVS